MHVDIGESPVWKFKFRLVNHFFQKFENLTEPDLKRLYSAFKLKKVDLFIIVLILRNKAFAFLVNRVQLEVGFYTEKHFEIQR
jgi:hypothetical protein